MGFSPAGLWRTSLLGPVDNLDEMPMRGRRGVTIGWNPDAMARARREVLKLLKCLLG